MLDIIRSCHWQVDRYSGSFIQDSWQLHTFLKNKIRMQTVCIFMGDRYILKKPQCVFEHYNVFTYVVKNFEKIEFTEKILPKIIED